MSADKTDRGYDKTLPEAPAANARADVTRVQEDLTTKGATEALTRLYDEADPAKGLSSIARDAAAQTQYRDALAKELTDNKILPALSIAAVRGLGDAVKTDGGVDVTKVIKRMQESTDPVQRTLLGGFISQYDQLKRESPYVNGQQRVTDQVLQTKIEKTTKEAQENVALKAKATKDQNELGDLLTNPDLFKAISSKPDGGSITKGDAEAFLKRITEGTKPEDVALRQKFAGTPEADAKLRKTMDSLIKSFDDPKNDPEQKGTTLKDGGPFQTRWHHYMTPESLATGMGFENPTKAKEALDKGVKPISGVEPVTSLDHTRLRAGLGPQDLAHRMLDPTKEQAHFKDRAALDQARRDLEYVFRKGGPILQDKGKPEVTAANRDQIITEIQAREKANAERDKKPVDNTLSNWFASKYPKDMPAAVAPGTNVDNIRPDTDRTRASVKANDGPERISRRMGEGELNENQRRILQSTLVPGKTYDDQVGKLSDASIEKVRAAIEALKPTARMTEAEIAYVKAWYAKKYPKA